MRNKNIDPLPRVSMLSLEKGLALFEAELEKVSHETLYAELRSHEPVGPFANGFICTEATPGDFYSLTGVINNVHESTGF